MADAQVVEQPQRNTQALKIVDSDVHATPKDGLKSLLPYMSRAWQEQFATIARAKEYRYPNPRGAVLGWNAVPPNGGEPGSDLAFLQEDLLKRWHIHDALIIPLEWVNAWSDPRLASAYVSALNDYFVQEWLSVDARLKLAIVVSPHDPVAAAAEIRRLAGTRHVAAAFLPLINIKLGHPYFNPIYEAAQDVGIPIVSHPTGAEGTYQGAAMTAGGITMTYAERNVALATLSMDNTVNMIYEGVFERFPKLKMVFAEWGFTWVPSVLWGMDKRWRELRREIPWVKRPPSDYVFEHVRYTTQPVDGPESQDELLAVLKAMHAERTLLFSTDYPHRDNDEPFRVFAGLPTELRERIYSENARETFGHQFV